MEITRIHCTLMWYIDTCDEWGIKRFQARLRRVWNRFIPHESQVSISIYRNQGVVDSLPINTKNVFFIVKTQEHRRFEGCLTVVTHKEVALNRMHRYVVMVTPWRLFGMQNKACHPLRLKPYRYIQKYQTRFYICRFTTSLCQGIFVVCVYMHINPD